MLNQRLSFPGLERGYAGVTIPRKIDEIKRGADSRKIMNPIKINRLRTPRRAAGKRQPVVSSQRVNQAGLTNVTSPQKGNLG